MRELHDPRDDPGIREMRPTDVESVAGLCAELGYRAGTAEVASRIEDLAGCPEEAVFVAELAGTVVGWVHVGVVRALTHAPEARVHGLVVEQARRGGGIGRLLLRRAEAWSAERGLSRVRLTSRIAREDAHRFYERSGYVRSKTQHVFQRDLA